MNYLSVLSNLRRSASPQTGQTLRRLGRDQAGASAVEFALLAPVLLMLAVGIAQFGLVINDYIMLTEGVRDGVHQLALARGTSTPYTSTTSRVRTAAGNLVQASLTITITVNGTACSTDTACQTALSGAAGQPAAVSATYPCQLRVMAIDFLPSCTLSSTTTETIE